MIVGGGTACLTLTRRLAANPSFTVAVVEGGSYYELDNEDFSQVPADAIYWVCEDTMRNPLVDWYQLTRLQSVNSL